MGIQISSLGEYTRIDPIIYTWKEKKVSTSGLEPWIKRISVDRLGSKSPWGIPMLVDIDYLSAAPFMPMSHSAPKTSSVYVPMVPFESTFVKNLT